MLVEELRTFLIASFLARSRLLFLSTLYLSILATSGAGTPPPELKALTTCSHTWYKKVNHLHVCVMVASSPGLTSHAGFILRARGNRPTGACNQQGLRHAYIRTSTCCGLSPGAAELCFFPPPPAVDVNLASSRAYIQKQHTWYILYYLQVSTLFNKVQALLVCVCVCVCEGVLHGMNVLNVCGSHTCKL